MTIPRHTHARDQYIVDSFFVLILLTMLWFCSRGSEENVVDDSMNHEPVIEASDDYSDRTLPYALKD